MLECFSLTESAIWSAPIWYPEQMQSPSASDLAKYFSLTQTQKLLRYGNYYTQLKPFLKVFKEDEIIFYNGNRLGKIQLRFWRPYNMGKSSIGNLKSGLETKKIHWKQSLRLEKWNHTKSKRSWLKVYLRNESMRSAKVFVSKILAKYCYHKTHVLSKLSVYENNHFLKSFSREVRLMKYIT